MSLFHKIERLAIRIAILLPSGDGYWVYHTNSLIVARSMLSQIEQSILDINHEIVDERPFMAVMTTNEVLPDVNLLLVPIRDISTTTPKIIPLTGESSLHEMSKREVYENMLILPVKNKVSLFKSNSAQTFIDKIGTFIEQRLIEEHPLI